MRLARWGARVGLTALGALAISTCQITDVLTTPGVVNVSLSYAGDTVLVLGSAVVASASAQVDGAALPRAQFAFSSSDTSIVAVRAGDSLVAKKRGSVTLTVTLVSSVLPSDPPSLARELTVVVDTVTLDSTAVTFASLGDTARLVATALDANGDPVSGAPVTWTTSDTSVVSVTTTGRLQARGNGTAVVRAVVDVDTAAVSVTVQQVLVRYTFQPATLTADALGQTLTPTAIPRDARGNVIQLPGLGPTWSIDDPSIGQLNATTGAVTSLLNGSTFLRATRDTVSDSLAYLVDQRAAVVLISPDPVPPLTSLGQQVQLTARGVDRLGQDVQDAVASWFTLDPVRVRVSTDGLATALALGTGRVLALMDGILDTAVIQISNTPVAIEVTPDTAVATSVGDTLVFQAVVRNGRGDSIVGASVTWRSTDSTVARVLPSGRTVTLRTGTARIIAQSGSPADTGVAIIRNEVATLDIVPAGRLLASLGAVDTPSVEIENARGASLGRGVVAWTTDDANIARVNALGLVTAVDTGQTYIRATSGALTDSVLYTVTNEPVSIAILGRVLDTLTALGQQLSYTADVRNGRNAAISGYPVAWTSSDTNQVRVDTANGVATATVTGFGAGVRIIAQAGTARDTVFVVARNPTLLVVDNAVVVTGPRVGTLSRPYARIQDAIDAAEADDTVLVRRGTGIYRESLNLLKRLIILGDSGLVSDPNAFRNTRNPAVLPLLSHDTGSAAITAFTTAQLIIRNVAVRHTLDGPALDADGSDVTLEWFFVNPLGSVTSRIGRGISIKNSPSATSIRNARIRDVRAYGIRLENVLGAIVSRDSIVRVDSVAFVEDGAAIKIVGGGTIGIDSNTLREAQGPLITANGSAALIIRGNQLFGKQTQVRLDNLASTAVSFVIGNTFDLNSVAGNDNLNSVNDGRAGLQILNTTSPSITTVQVVSNTFRETPFVSSGTFSSRMDAIRAVDSRLVLMSFNSFTGVRYAVRATNLTGSSVTSARADSVAAFVVAEGLDSLVLSGDTVRTATLSCVSYPASVDVGGSPVDHTDPSSISLTASLFQNCATFSGGSAISMVSVGGTPDLLLRRSTIKGLANTIAVHFQGGDFLADTTAFRGPANPADTARLGASSVFSAVNIIADGFATFRGNVISDFHRFTGLSLNAGSSLSFGANRITRNRRGFTYTGGGGALVGCGASCAINDVFDNDSAGFVHAGVAATFPDSIWWGDGRGPRSGASLATGDSVNAGPVTLTSSDSSQYSGTTATGLRIVRGDGQTALRGTVLPKAFTVRVVDEAGLPVSGVSVQFSVTGGGGNLSGSETVTVPTNGSGLAEATLTLGASTGSNTVTVSTMGLQDITFTATGL